MFYDLKNVRYRYFHIEICVLKRCHFSLHTSSLVVVLAHSCCSSSLTGRCAVGYTTSLRSSSSSKRVLSHEKNKSSDLSLNTKK